MNEKKIDLFQNNEKCFTWNVRKQYEPDDLTLMDFWRFRMDFVRYSIHSITISTPPESYSFFSNSNKNNSEKKKVTVLARPTGEKKFRASKHITKMFFSFSL
jgi:histidinol phosphatase-like PHP family hydrolase